MAIAPGARLGPYEILASLGAGGMGEVYRARDARLAREVAIKVLPAELAADASRLKRFEKEARSASALNHPSIVTVYDIGREDSVSYIAMELVEGKTLRESISPGPMAVRKALSIAVQIADGLSKAHEAGIVHRDLKPENVMVARDGRVKILDFGLAKSTHSSVGSETDLPTETGTGAGMVLGTVGYMSPEQASGEPLDFRSDQFSFGSILYEMATGKRAFQKKTGVETLTAIIREEPDPIGPWNSEAPAPLRWIVERCLAKDPEDRYGSTRDLARDLAGLRDRTADGREAASLDPTPKKRRLALVAAAGLALAAGLAVTAWLAGKSSVDRRPPYFQQLTFRRGSVYSARFGPDGETIVYTAAWDGKPMEIFLGRIQSADARPFGLPGAEVLAVSSGGELAVSLDRAFGPTDAPARRIGTLARLSIGGGTAPRAIAQDVEWADWAPDGKTLAIVRGGKLEYPPGKVLHAAPAEGRIGPPRVSPSGDAVAFIEHAATGDDAGSVVIVDRDGGETRLPHLFVSAQGLAWSPQSEVWFTATGMMGSTGSVFNRTLYAATRSGKVRALSRIAGSMTLQDVSRQGRALLTRDSGRQGIVALSPGESMERELTWLDWAGIGWISSDGRLALFTGPSGNLGLPEGGGGDSNYFAYLRKTDGSPPLRVGEGEAAALSPDGKWVLAVEEAPLQKGVENILVYPTGAGEPRRLPQTGLASWGFGGACFFPDSRRFVFAAAESNREPRAWVRDIEGGKPTPLTPEGYFGSCVAPEGDRVLVTGPGWKAFVYRVDGGKLAEVQGLGAGEGPVQFADDGRSLYVVGPKEVPRKVYRLDPSTGHRELWRSVGPADPVGVSEIRVFPTPDGKSYLYNYTRALSDLYLVEGLR